MCWSWSTCAVNIYVGSAARSGSAQVVYYNLVRFVGVSSILYLISSCVNRKYLTLGFP
jgi:hypothetical protein